MIDNEALSNLEKLHKLKTDGVITEADFEEAKATLLTQSVTQKKPSSANRPVVSSIFDGTLPAEDDFLAWMILPIRRYADFSGRSRRKEFWMFQILLTGLTATAVFLGLSLTPTHPWEEDSGWGAVVFAMWLLCMLGLIIPLLALEVRRFHDQDKSGWFALFNVVPYIGSMLIYILMLLDGTHGDNQYGPDPLNR